LNITTIVIKKETRNALKKIGLKGETYDEIILKLIKAGKRRPNLSGNSQLIQESHKRDDHGKY
jgi:predicted CopG family antitoxin